MGEGFRKFKRKILFNTLIRSILYGVSFGLGAVSVVMIINKLVPLGMKWIFYMPISFGAAAVCGAISFLILRQNDKKISRRIDRELDFSEKVQTMLEFSGEQGDIIELQRQDTEQKLIETVPRGFGTKRLWICAITLVMSAALLAVGILTPAKQPEPPYDPDYDMSDWQIVSLKNLIQYVQNSKMADRAKDDTVKELEELLTSLSDASKESRKKTLVVGAITDIRTVVDDNNAYDELGGFMRASNFDRMTKFDKALKDFIDLPTSSAYDEIRAEFSEGDRETLSASIARFSQEVGACLRGFQGNKALPLYAALDSLCRGMDTLSGEMISQNYSDADIQNRLDELFDISAKGLYAAMSVEHETGTVGDYTVSELMRIFGITDSDLPGQAENDNNSQNSDDKKPGEDENPDDSDKDLSDGGIGTGELIYGSDDLIYYPNEEKYVKYGEVINEYSAKIYEMLLDGNVSDEMKDYINNYLSMLFDGSKRN